MNHGFVDVFAFQEALLIEAVFGVAILAMIWAGFRRWLRHKEKMGHLIAEETAERAEQNSVRMVSVEERLKAIEEVVGAETPVAIEAAPKSPISDGSLT